LLAASLNLWLSKCCTLHLHHRDHCDWHCALFDDLIVIGAQLGGDDVFEPSNTFVLIQFVVFDTLFYVGEIEAKLCQDRVANSGLFYALDADKIPESCLALHLLKLAL